ncbi:septum site-determining protein MinC [Xylella fastidiosa subsp. morus]|jgi:septum site-determining protein MinC|uniref:Probable septum site-determining protein MinC n=3 Tax=Xylella fastidiosa TaxID=2371 RepID=MINC_XYLFT|nr:septum site-determining protein MinC [Xylella fastidiosa]B2I967.1 RecName: Full=Probable septum site-determining protein MinC [Xylella fastidiosa M23]Q87DW2.1 RecName: Full=Probable septum site-determining protein MinC [Xylella fastidiosa Temecula1]ADN63570.1 septum formation inhibitor [Xylella fastidiosa subsp. fastidiosa GB514]KAF0572322.1 septation inhibitor protein [Xylella fastidiosa subsp. fastidiosa Mus-1]AAO28441.1 cell division inhibitor [Xylella fastidiosa Temecula1]ACB92042.1 se
MSNVNMDFEQAGELKIGQVGIATLRIRTLNVPRLIQEMSDRVTRAPKLFRRTAVILDFGELPHPPDLATAKALVEGLRAANVLPVAIAYGTNEIDLLSQQLGLPLLSKFRAHYERQEVAAPPPQSTPPISTGRIQHTTVRSGQQLYAEHCDLTILNTVGAGAEVIADGNIHIYGTLRGRAMAGARGNAEMRIFCRDFQAELIAIAGRYKVLDDIPTELRGKAVQVWLEQNQIKIAALD